MSQDKVIVNDQMNDKLNGMMLPGEAVLTKEFTSAQGRVRIQCNTKKWVILLPDGNTEFSNSTDTAVNNMTKAKAAGAMRVGTLTELTGS